MGAFDEGGADVGDAEGGAVGRVDVVVYHGSEVESHVVFGHADLTWNFHDLDFDVDTEERFGERVDEGEAGVDCAGEASEFCNEADGTLIQ